MCPTCLKWPANLGRKGGKSIFLLATTFDFIANKKYKTWCALIVLGKLEQRLDKKASKIKQKYSLFPKQISAKINKEKENFTCDIYRYMYMCKHIYIYIYVLVVLMYDRIYIAHAIYWALAGQGGKEIKGEDFSKPTSTQKYTKTTSIVHGFAKPPRQELMCNKCNVISWSKIQKERQKQNTNLPPPSMYHSAKPKRRKRERKYKNKTKPILHSFLSNGSRPRPQTQPKI